ncbi:MAG: DtxR family transcriptional regulator, Mn-dependent transcriptional regulator [Frankiales bacterium]|jgi:DtxR family Mn-dependent transcriptional regulator|nr:DtxR family transcriptional regulator, Mn-dependent transcriptional regulator [Frankiales bacterium]
MARVVPATDARSVGQGSGYHPAVEEYLETIFELEESGVPPMRARLVERLHVSAPAVSETVGRLEREGYVTLDERRVVHLTDHGRRYATSIMRRHRLAERLLVDVLKVPWHQVHEEAGRLEHAISANLENHLVRLLGDPATCPHGNPIPGSANKAPAGPVHALADVTPADQVEVRRISEEIEADVESMLLLEECGLTPGSTANVISVDGDVTVRTIAGESLVPAAVASKVYVAVITD